MIRLLADQNFNGHILVSDVIEVGQADASCYLPVWDLPLAAGAMRAHSRRGAFAKPRTKDPIRYPSASA